MMDKNLTINSLSAIHQTLLEDEDYIKAIEALNAIKINRLINFYLNAAEDYDDSDKLIIELIIRVLQNIYNNSGEQSPVTDEDYDKLYELQRDVNEEEIVGSTFNASDKAVQSHTYTSLRGTLDKIHFMTIEQKGKDKRKSLQDWLKAIENKLGRKLTSKEKEVHLYPKWDGLSGVFECDELGDTELVLSRGDTDKNEALDLTAMFRGANLLYIFGEGDTPKNRKFGVKTEIIMSNGNYAQVCEKYGNFSSARSAVSSILNSKELDRKYLKYLTIMPLQYQMMGDEIPHVAPYDYKYLPHSSAVVDDYEGMELTINELKKDIEEKCDYNIDGIVIRLVNENLQKELGREGRINKYEVAYKFPPEEKKTIIKDVVFQVGLLGAIAPVAIIEPVKIKGNVITNISLGSIDRFESLNLRQNDEVIVKYDVIPYLAKDDTCKTGQGKVFVTPEECPYCHKELVKDPVLKCINMDCESRIIGKILNYVEKMVISNISIGTITTLFKEDILKSIEDLYKLKDKERQIVKLDGFGSKSFKNIISGIDSRREVFDYELLGSIGIPDIGRRIFKKILNIYYLDELIDICIKNKSEKLTQIGGIKERTAKKIIDGINYNLILIKFLRSELKVNHDTRKYNIKVCFTKVRDKEFEKYLDSKNVLVLDKYSKQVDLLIIKDKFTESDKIDKAQKDHKEIVTLEEAYQIFQYKR